MGSIRKILIEIMIPRIITKREANGPTNLQLRNIFFNKKGTVRRIASGNHFHY